MKIKVMNRDGAVMDAEGTVEELEKLLWAFLTPVAVALSAPINIPYIASVPCMHEFDAGSTAQSCRKCGVPPFITNPAYTVTRIEVPELVEPARVICLGPGPGQS